MTPPLRVAVADDEPDVRQFFQTVLPLLGFEVACAAGTGRELVDGCRAANPDVILTDVRMPDLDGIEAAAAVCRERPVPVVLVTAHSDPDTLARVEADQVQGLLVKPIKV